jgi:hypothetical protein
MMRVAIAGDIAARINPRSGQALKLGPFAPKRNRLGKTSHE